MLQRTTRFETGKRLARTLLMVGSDNEGLYRRHFEIFIFNPVLQESVLTQKERKTEQKNERNPKSTSYGFNICLRDMSAKYYE